MALIFAANLRRGEITMKTNILQNSIRLAALAAITLLPRMAHAVDLRQPCTYSASAPSIAAAGGYVTMQVYTQPQCQWQVVGGAQDMRIYSGNVGRGNGIVTLYVSPNMGPARTFLLNVMRSYGDSAFKCNLTQDAHQVTSCTYSVSSPSIAAAGGYVSMKIYTQSQCQWQVVGNTKDILIRSGNVGRGNGVVTAYLSPNMGPARTLPLYIQQSPGVSGFKFYLTQDARK
jgi:hypothetical protein